MHRDGFARFRIEVDMKEGEERAIHLGVNLRDDRSAQMATVKLYVKFGEPADEENFDIIYTYGRTNDYTIGTGDSLFHRSGTYYLYATLDWSRALMKELFHKEDDEYDFSLRYLLEGSFDFVTIN